MLDEKVVTIEDIIKKQKDQEDNEIKNYLYRKGYMTETINIAFDEINDK